jgi:hypothetical protein
MNGSPPKPESNPLKVDPNSKYNDPKIKLRQRVEGWTLSLSLLIAIGLTSFIWWRVPAANWSAVALAGLAGIIAGLLHSLKWFYRTVGNGEWDWDRVWWRFLNPLVSGVMGMSIYIIFRSGIAAKQSENATLPITEGFYAYSIGFLTGLFADNAMSKLRDIAYTLFGPTAPPASKPKTKDSSGQPSGSS